MKQSERPATSLRGIPQFGHQHWQTYLQYTSKMSVTISSPDPKYTNDPAFHAQDTCAVPPALEHLTWREGIIQSFDSNMEKLILCGYLVGNSKQAHAALVALTPTIRRTISTHEAPKLTRKRIGDESIGFRYMPGNGTAEYDAVFRKSNAVIELHYKGMVDYPVTSYLEELMRIASRTKVR